MYNKLLIILMFSLTIFLNAEVKNWNHRLTVKQKVEDFNYLYDILKNNYPYFWVNKRMNNIDWLANKKQYLSKIKATKTDREYLIELNNILKELKNGHTDVIEDSYYRMYLKISPKIGKSWEEVFDDKIREKYTYWNNLDETIDLMNGIGRYSKLFPEFKIMIDKNSGFLKNKKSNPKEVRDHLDKLISDNPVIGDKIKKYREKHFKSYFSKDKKLFISKIIKTGKGIEVPYIKLGSFGDDKLNSQEIDKIIKFILKIDNQYKNLIVDIRNNGGGNDKLWSDKILPYLVTKELKTEFYLTFRGGDYTLPFIKSYNGLKNKKLTPISDLPQKRNLPPEIMNSFKYYIPLNYNIIPKSSKGFKGHIYLLVNKYVFSSSEALAAFSKATKFAIIVGTPTGGDGIGIDPCIVSLPNSGLIVRFPIDLGLNPDGSSNFEAKTIPDVIIKPNEDALNKTLEIIEPE